MPFPANFNNLHDGEEFLRGTSIAAIEAETDLSLHAEMIAAAMDVLDQFARVYAHEDQDQLVIQLLGIRLFNGSASAMKTLVSGYYQTSALMMRDMLETAFLLKYLCNNPALIARWKVCSEDERQREFGPAKIRIALDDKDGFTERKREQHYKLLCSLAGHPTYVGFQMLAPIPGGDAHCGPFFELRALEATLSELAKLSVIAAGTFTIFFRGRTRADYETKIAFMETQGKWQERFFERPFDATLINDLTKMLTALPPASG